MGTRIGFYHLQALPLDAALPRLLDKVLSAGHKALVMAGSAERVAYLDALLWTWQADSWLPHGSLRDADAILQPVFLTDRDDNPNQADVLLLTDGVESAQVDTFARCLNLFNGQDEAAVSAARAQWKKWLAQGFDLTYYQQTESGGWQEKAKSR